MNRANLGASTNFIQILLDIVIAFFSLIITVLTMDGLDISGSLKKYVVIYFIFVVIYVMANRNNKVYNITTFYYVDRIVRKVTKSYMIAAVSVSFIIYFLADDNNLVLFSMVLLPVSYFMLTIFSLMFRYLQRIFSTDKGARCLFVGKKEDYVKFDYYLDKTNINTLHLGYVALNANESDNAHEGEYVGCLDELEQLIRTYNADQVYFMIRDDGDEQYKQYIEICSRMGVTVKTVIDMYRSADSKCFTGDVGTYPVITYHFISLNTFEQLIKRFFDIIGALFGIILSSPIMIIVALLIKLTSKGPVIFKQVRIGMNGRRFHIYKFRTMYKDAEQQKEALMDQNEVDGFMFKMKDDPRITPVGKFLRKTSLDELPQFFNVLIGNMSLVGTRPPTPDEVDNYQINHWKRISIKPGITGMWQVNGRSNLTSFDEVVALDTAYIDNWSVMLDIKIMFKTVLVLFMHDGAY